MRFQDTKTAQPLVVLAYDQVIYELEPHPVENVLLTLTGSKPNHGLSNASMN